jgi:signal transduction histidine kinase
MAHEINNPLNFIAINFANIREITSDLRIILTEYKIVTQKFEDGTLSPLDVQKLRKRESELNVEMLIDDIPEIIVESQRGFERITAVINSMRNLSHRYAIDKKIPFDINQGIIDTLTIARHEYSSCADIKTTLGELPLIACNPEQINQVFLNLIINSVHAIQSQKRHANGTITIQTWFDSSNVYCSIADDGPGIPEAIQKDIFNPFFTTKNSRNGTGLGLSISWDIIVVTHKGTLAFTTPAEGGTIFTLSLPRTNDD